MLNPIALAIPGFFALMAVELGVGWRRGLLRGTHPLYRPADAAADLGCGIVSQVTGMVLSAGVFAGVYTGVYDHARLLTLPEAPWVWIAAFIAVDFVYYLWHRASHRVNVLWAAHVVHHQSEDYNLAVALRQAVFTPLTSLPFYLPFALLGVSPLVFLTCSALNTLYQFWIHTRLVRRLGPIEWVWNTPSHHRVHHGVNPGYIDRNHAGVFIVWDRLFGTFTPETEPPIYGVVEGFPTANVFRANLDPWVKLGRAFSAARGMDRLRVLFGPPEWRPAAQGGPVQIPTPAAALRWDPQVGPAWTAWFVLWLLVASAALTASLFGQGTWPLGTQVGVGVAILWTVATWGGLVDDRPWARPAELARLVVLPLASAALDLRLAAVMAGLSVVSVLLLERARRG